MINMAAILDGWHFKDFDSLNFVHTPILKTTIIYLSKIGTKLGVKIM